MIYHSKTTSNIEDYEIENILKTARKFNTTNNITGCLLFHNNQFLQILEGDFDKVNKLYKKIRTDTRHKNVITLHMQEIKNLSYRNWSMAYQKFSNDSIKHTLGIREFNDILDKNDFGSTSKEIFIYMSQIILASN
ncbi:BLUF domain-containing protein [Roseivirga ehrenbergii]|uniref:BLUF domain-containing protein n=1 Tax=Roseivirga ehrenbergii (strain DSM 102268 / JCM 13514 / KCTC 12282 / NCIMB 14502 / KMM 6017) TaxID=279360 RepID=UPI0012FD9547|nr:BLUF domain-containing protein [Roseivirga ehrenbergii]